MTRVLFTVTEITGDCGHHFFFLPTDSGLNKNFQGFFPAKPHLNNGLIQLIFCFVLVSIHFLLMFPFLARLI